MKTLDDSSSGPQHLKILAGQEEAFIDDGSMAGLRIHETPNIDIHTVY